MLRKYHPIWINTHFNHTQERFTQRRSGACEQIVDAGIPLGNQSVLLKGVNDSADTMKGTASEAGEDAVRPYNLYQCDLSRGIAHFRTRVETGIDILHKLTGNISGYALPGMYRRAGRRRQDPAAVRVCLKRRSESCWRTFRAVVRYPQPRHDLIEN
jgi:lysine 2,3-aminomutase